MSMSSSSEDLSQGFSRKTHVFGLRVWALTGIIVALFILIILLLLSLCLTSRRRRRRRSAKGINMIPLHQFPNEIKDIRIDPISSDTPNAIFYDKFSDKESEKVLINSKMGDNSSHSGSLEDEAGLGRISVHKPSPLSGLPDFSRLGWGHWFTLRDLELATNWFSKDSVIGEGGYGVVFRGHLINGSPVAVKKLLNNL